MDIRDIATGDKVWHKHRRCIVTVTEHHTDPEERDRDYVVCYRDFNEKPLKTHPDLLKPIEVAGKRAAT